MNDHVYRQAGVGVGMLNGALHEGMADESYFTAVDEEADRFAAELREGCVTMETMPGETMWDHVYAEDHPVMEAERAAYLAYKASFEEAN